MQHPTLLDDTYQLAENGRPSKGILANRPGFIGIKKDQVPAGWTRQKLKNSFSLSSGKTKPSDIMEEPAPEQKIPVYGGNGVTGYTEKALRESETVIIGRVGEYCGSIHHVDEPCWITDNAMYASDFNDGESIRFISYFLSYLKLGLLRNKGGQPLISQKPVLNKRVSIPPLPERHQIANILATWDRALAQLDALIAAKERRKKALMQQLLTDRTRFPEFDGEWREVRVKELGEVVTGGTPKTSMPEYWGGGIAWCTPTDITALAGKDIFQTERTLTKVGVENSSSTVLPPGSLIVCTRATIGDCAINMVPMATNQGFKSIIPSEKADVDFLYYWFNFFQHELVRLGAGSTFLEVSKKDHGRLVVDLPALAEQKKIAAVLSTCDDEIETLRAERNALQRQKKGMMQKLLTGTVRVPTDESHSQAIA